MARSPRSSFDKNPLRLRLAALRRRLRLVVAVRGAGWLLTLLLLTIAAAGALDWAFHLPQLVRGLILVGLLAGAGVVGLVYLLKPLLDRIDDLTLALRIEDRYPSLNDALASTIQFLEQAERKALLGETTPRSDSPAMRREAARRALQKAEGCDFNRVIDTRGFRAAGVSGLSAVALAAVLVLLFPATASTALKRLAEPFGAHRWPSATTLELEPHRERIGRNEGFEVRARVLGVIPEKATVVYNFGDTSEKHEYRIVKENGSGYLLAQLRPGQMTRTFKFQVKANDAETEEFEVVVAPAPTLALLDGRPTPQVQLFYPDYTELPAHALPDGTGSIDAVAGTVATLRAAANVPLRAAWLEYQPEPREVLLSAHLAPLCAGDPLAAAAAGISGLDLCGRHPAKLSTDRKSFHIRFQPRTSGTYSIHIEDDTRLQSHRTYELRVRPDPAPAVTLERPSAQRETLDVLPTATLPVRIDVQDPVYGIRSVWLEYRCHTDDSFQRLPLYTPGLVAKDVLTSPLAWPGFGALAARVKPVQYLIERRLALSQLRHPDGSSLRPGDVITLRACADDYDTVAVGKQPGTSSEVEIRIVTRPALDLALSREQARIQQDLQEVKQLQLEATRKVTEIENRVARTRKLSLEDQAELARIEQAQQQIRERLEAEGQESVKSRVERVLETLRENDVTRSAAEQRLEPLRRELDRLGREELQQIEAALTGTRRQAEAPEEARAEAAAKALEQAGDRSEKQAQQLEKLAADQTREQADRARLTEEVRKLRQQRERLRELAREARQDAKNETPEAEGRAQKRSEELKRLAEERERLARDLEKNAARDTTGQERELLKQAKEQKDTAGGLREQARTQRESQNRQTDDNQSGLTEARRRQEEVEKTLGDLLKNLEPWSTTREVKNEARNLLDAQRRLNDEVEAMQKQLGADREKLTPEQKAQLDNAEAAQQKLRERMRQLTDKMQRLAEERKAADPATAQEMQEAFEQAQRSGVPAEMENARDQLKQNNLGNAGAAQKKALEGLEQLVKKMEDRREAELDRNIKKMKEAEQKLDELAEEQDRLRKKVKEAEKIADPKKREEELKRLARAQKDLQEKTQQAARELSRMRAERASEAANQAAKQMEEAVRRLERGEPPAEQQEEALDKLDEAKEDVEKARDKNEEELAREQLARVADVLKRIKERHDRLVSDLDRLQKEVLEQKGWTRTLALGTLSDTASAQKGLAEEALSLTDRELANAEVFARQLRRAAEAMKAAGELLELFSRREIVAGNTEMPVEGQRLQKQAQRRLQMLLDALKMDEGERLRPQNGANRGGGGASRGGGGDGIPPLAQLKLLRAMQAEVNERTAEFSKKHPDPAKLTEEEKKELVGLQREQRAVADLIEEHSRPEKDEGEKK